MVLVPIRIGERVIQVSPEKAAQIRAKQAENRRNNSRIDSELRSARLIPRGYTNTIAKTTKSNFSVKKDREIDTVASWKRSKIDRMHEAFNELCA